METALALQVEPQSRTVVVYFSEIDMACEGYLHILRVDLAPEVEDEVDRWYNTVHVPALLACTGWLSARR